MSADIAISLVARGIIARADQIQTARQDGQHLTEDEERTVNTAVILRRLFPDAAPKRSTDA